MRRLALGFIAGLCLAAGFASADVPDPCHLPLAASPQAFGHVDIPAPGQNVFGIVPVSGWNLDLNSISSINLCIDGAYVATADINLPRVDVLNAFPTYANSPTAQPGFITSFYTKSLEASGACNTYDDGDHLISIRVVESDNPNVAIDIADIPVVVRNFNDDGTPNNQAPFGFIDIPDPSAADTEGFDSAHPVVGWAIDDSLVDHIDVLVDGQIVATAVCCNVPGAPISGSAAGTATYGGTRPDVQAAFPCVPWSLFSGWSANIDTTALVNGLHTISARVTDDQGASRVMGTRTVQTDNASGNLHPFGDIDYPLDELTFTFVPPCLEGEIASCGPSGGSPSPITPPVSSFDIVSGWVLDTGSRLDFGQTGYVELLIDGVIIANTRRDCVNGPNGVFENCYGVNRPDVERLYPGFVNSDNAGYVFDFVAIDNGSGNLLISIPLAGGGFRCVTEIAPGKHDITVRAGDVSETVEEQIGIPLSAIFTACRPVGSAQDVPSIGYVDYPYFYQFVDGQVTIVGWAFDVDDGVKDVQLDVDGTIVSQCDGSPFATFPISRPDVEKRDPRVNTTQVGWTFCLDTTKLGDSAHDINVYVTDHRSIRTLVGRTKIVVNNNVPTHGPGL
jgi:hypothetical protein